MTALSCPCDCPPALVCFQAPDLTSLKGPGCRDGWVGVPDLLLLLQNWGECGDVPCFSPTGWCCEYGDLNRDGWVEVADLLILLDWWGELGETDEAWLAWRCQP